jgi:hypothetical protein
MEIINFTKKKDGNLVIPIESEKFIAVCAHMREKGLSVGGTHNTAKDLNDIWVEATIEEVNQALADFEEI